MDTDQVKAVLNKVLYFKLWAKQIREPTLDNPPDYIRDRGDLARLEANIKIFESTDHSPQRDENLAISHYLRQLTLWRLFPFNSLPDDIILQIFRQGTFCSPDNPCAPIMPVTYSSVCKRWRDLSLEASWLWSFLGFRDASPFTLTKLFLERSKFAPLTIEIDLTDKKFDFEDDEFWPTADQTIERVSLLRPHAHRWKTFYCCTDNWAPLEGALSMTQDLATPILKTVEFRKNYDILSPFESLKPNPLMLFGGGAPALQELVLRTVSIDWQNPTFNNLSVLELHRLSREALPSLRSFWTMLDGSPNLQKLTLVESGPRWEKEIGHHLPCLDLPCLEELTFKGTGSREDAGYTLGYASFVLSMFVPGPGLRSLTIGGFAPDDDLSQALPLLRKFAHIKHLVLSDIHFTSTAAADWLSAFPEMCHLAFVGAHTQRAVMEALAITLSPWNDLCPLLTTLSPYDVDPQAISAVLHARLMHHRPIRTLVFDINLKHETAELEELRDIVEIAFEGEEWDEEEWTGPDPYDWPMEE